MEFENNNNKKRKRIQEWLSVNYSPNIRHNILHLPERSHWNKRRGRDGNRYRGHETAVMSQNEDSG